VTKTYDDILSTEDLENLDSFLDAWDASTSAMQSLAYLFNDQDLDAIVALFPARKKECADLRRKLAVAIHYSEGGDRP
jgi:hypothetical protein